MDTTQPFILINLSQEYPPDKPKTTKHKTQEQAERYALSLCTSYYKNNLLKFSATNLTNIQKYIENEHFSAALIDIYILSDGQVKFDIEPLPEDFVRAPPIQTTRNQISKMVNLSKRDE